jgi:AraC family transcriptional regulator
MPYRRRMLLRTPLIEWQQIETLAASAPLAHEHLVVSPRLVLPLTSHFEAQIGGARFVCDALGALWLTPERGYRLRHATVGQRSDLLVLNPVQKRACAGGLSDELSDQLTDERTDERTEERTEELSADLLAALGASRRLAVDASLHAALAHCRAAYAQGAVDALKVEETLFAALPVADAAAHATIGGTIRRAVERAREAIAAEPERNASLATIARLAACSPFHLARSFRRCTGRSLHGHRNELRMALAVERLCDGDTDLARLALDLGFAGHSHFGAVFRRRFGTPPGVMRRNLIARRPLH